MVYIHFVYDNKVASANGMLHWVWTSPVEFSSARTLRFQHSPVNFHLLLEPIIYIYNGQKWSLTV